MIKQKLENEKKLYIENKHHFLPKYVGKWKKDKLKAKK